MNRIDVTKDVRIGWVDDEAAQLKRCICGQVFGSEILSIYEDTAWQCEACGRKLIIAQTLTVFELREEPDAKDTE